MRNYIRPGVDGPSISTVVYHINDLKLPGPETRLLLGRGGDNLRVRKGVINYMGQRKVVQVEPVFDGRYVYENVNETGGAMKSEIKSEVGEVGGGREVGEVVGEGVEGGVVGEVAGEVVGEGGEGGEGGGENENVKQELFDILINMDIEKDIGVDMTVQTENLVDDVDEIITEITTSGTQTEVDQVLADAIFLIAQSRNIETDNENIIKGLGDKVKTLQTVLSASETSVKRKNIETDSMNGVKRQRVVETPGVIKKAIEIIEEKIKQIQNVVEEKKVAPKVKDEKVKPKRSSAVTDKKVRPSGAISEKEELENRIRILNNKKRKSKKDKKNILDYEIRLMNLNK
jgi:hypothetical protein